MKIAIVRDRLRLPVSLRNAWLIEPGLEPHVRVAHLAFDLGAGHERGDRVDHEHVEGTRPDQHVGDLERLLSRVGLADQQLVDVDADRRGVHGIHRVLGVDVRAHATVALRLGDDVRRERRLPGRLRPEDLDDPATRQAADTEREVERQRAGRDGFHTDVAALAQLHDRTLAELLLDLAERHVECLFAIHRRTPLSAVLVCGVVVFGRGKQLLGTYRGGVTATCDQVRCREIRITRV